MPTSNLDPSYNKLDRIYASYGMNTNGREMSLRCPNAISLGKNEIPGLQLAFRGHADVEQNHESTLQIVLWYISEACEDALDKLEGYPHYYNKTMVPVTYRGKEYESMIYYMNHEHNYSPPSQRYIRMLEQGYREHGLDLNQIYSAPGYITPEQSRALIPYQSPIKTD